MQSQPVPCDIRDCRGIAAFLKASVQRGVDDVVLCNAHWRLLAFGTGWKRLALPRPQASVAGDDFDIPTWDPGASA